jgi:hypothetical protein
MHLKATHFITILLALVLSPASNGVTQGVDDSRAELFRHILELYQQAKYQAAIPLAEELVVLTKQARGSDDPDTAASVSWLALL